MLTSCIMTKEAPRGLKTLYEAGNRTDFSRNGNTFRKQVNLGNSEAEYIESENLKDVEDVGLSMKTLLTGLESKDWVLVCEALNDVRRLSMFHREACLICSDIFKAYRDSIVDSTDPLLVQLLWKSSQDKRFVCEAAEKALISMPTWVSPVLLLPKLQPYLNNKNPRIRAKASIDQLPESREAAHALLLELQNVYEKTLDMTPTEASEDPQTNSWEHFCNSKLSPSSAQVVLRVTNVAR
ncbi:putative homeobox-leucine zipper protein HAT5-like [Capsicum annuum]|nr:putative homeobox-leucine zipper protein HAT5-like [Capsicum annuum]